MKKINKEEKILLLIIIAVSMILCSSFLQMHYSSDTYCLMKWGYFEYPSHYFLLDGRLISTLVCYLAGLFNIPYTIYIVGMDIIGILLLSITVFVMYKTLLNVMKIEKKTNKFMLLLATYVLVFNQFSLEFLLFPESAVMCLGVITSVLAATKVISEDKYKYLKIFGLMLISIFSYQGLINIFPILAVLLIILKQEYEKTKIKENIVYSLKEIAKIIFVLFVVVVINLVAIKIGCSIIGDSSDRGVTIEDKEDFFKRLNDLPVYVDEIWNKFMNMLPKHINSIMVVVTVLLLLVYKKERKIEILLKYIILTIAICIICIAPIFVFNTGICGRVNAPIAEILGISLIFLILLIEQNIEKDKTKNKIIYIIITLIFMLNAIMILQNTAEHIAANKVDENQGKTINYLINKYEKESGNKVTKFSYAYDSAPQQYVVGIRKIGSLTERKFACPWCIQEALEFYCNREFEFVMMNINIYYSKFKVEDYTEFTEEQIVFIGDTMYMLIY